LTKDTVKICKILVQFETTVFYFLKMYLKMYSCGDSCIFSIITPVFSVTLSFRNHNMLI